MVVQLLHGIFRRQVVVRRFEGLLQQTLWRDQMAAKAHHALNHQSQGHDRADQKWPNRPTSRLYDGEQSQHSREFCVWQLWPSRPSTRIVDNFGDKLMVTPFEAA
jgi:hypothetical protein